jgi:hypothetical protein
MALQPAVPLVPRQQTVAAGEYGHGPNNGAGSY